MDQRHTGLCIKHGEISGATIETDGADIPTKGSECLLAGHFLCLDPGFEGSCDGDGGVDRDGEFLSPVIEHTVMQGARPDESDAYHRQGRQGQQQGHLRAEPKVTDNVQFNSSLSAWGVLAGGAAQAAFIASGQLPGLSRQSRRRVRTLAATAPVSVAVCFTLVMLLETSCVPLAACCTFREIS